MQSTTQTTQDSSTSDRAPIMSAMQRGKMRNSLLEHACYQGVKMRFYVAESDQHLQTFLSRVNLKVDCFMSIEEFMNRLEAATREGVPYSSVIPQHTLITHFASPLFYNIPEFPQPRTMTQLKNNRRITGFDMPESVFFLASGFIIEENGKFNELRDQTGYKWGCKERGIMSQEVLDGVKPL